MIKSIGIIIQKQTHVGMITLSRPKALSALSHEMVFLISRHLDGWENDPTVDFVLIEGDGQKAFCAGGDIQKLYCQGVVGDFQSGIQFWQDEYQLNAFINNYAKPIITIMDGITMGGGVGVACHASHRIACENTIIALPECSIGLIPDVGSSHLLAQAPGHLGEFLALTGYRLSGVEAVYCGFADYHVPQIRLAELVCAIKNQNDLTVISQYADPCPTTELERLEPEISEVFRLRDLNEIVRGLEQRKCDWADRALRKIKQCSPLSCKASLETVRKSRAHPGLENALKFEFRFVSRAMEQGDFLEGIRAAVIDKDKAPRWRHSSIADVSDDLVALMLSRALGGDILFKPHTGVSLYG